MTTTQYMQGLLGSDPNCCLQAVHELWQSLVEDRIGASKWPSDLAVAQVVVILATPRVSAFPLLSTWQQILSLFSQPVASDGHLPVQWAEFRCETSSPSSLCAGLCVLVFEDQFRFRTSARKHSPFLPRPKCARTLAQLQQLNTVYSLWACQLE